ncbi:ABC transporter substrate-binding protein [Aquabacterium sp.]|uniref:ABC transporter substrate-binding protein n=1 Tax=Aquabacterium sp. TaxID=1872578 RepID=UPI0037848F32
MLHFWTSPGEAKSLELLKRLIAERGHGWKDFAVVGGGGQNAMAALKQRVLAGNPPSSASIKGPAIGEWAALGVLANLDAMASFDHWDAVLPRELQAHVKHKGHYVAVPVNIHRVNWLWANAELLRQAGVTQPPASFEDFIAAAQRIKAMGRVALAHGGQPWQDFVLFESVALGVGGPAFYRQAVIGLDAAALGGATMRRVLQSFRQLKAYVDERSPGRDWNAATEMVIRGQAAFQFMGDWAKGEFLAAGQQPGRDFLCVPAPGSAGAFAYVVDTFAMFQLKNWEAQRAQGYLAYALLRPEFQVQFNRRKGSIPVRSDVPLDGFDACGKAARADFDAAAGHAGLLPSAAVDMALPTATQAALRNVVSDFWNHDEMPVAEAVDRLLLAAVKKKP